MRTENQELDLYVRSRELPRITCFFSGTDRFSNQLRNRGQIHNLKATDVYLVVSARVTNVILEKLFVT